MAQIRQSSVQISPFFSAAADFIAEFSHDTGQEWNRSLSEK
jgi:hypothetical protein